MWQRRRLIVYKEAAGVTPYCFYRAVHFYSVRDKILASTIFSPFNINSIHHVWGLHATHCAFRRFSSPTSLHYHFPVSLLLRVCSLSVSFPSWTMPTIKLLQVFLVKDKAPEPSNIEQDPRAPRPYLFSDEQNMYS